MTSHQYTEEDIRSIKFSFMVRQVAPKPLRLIIKKETEGKGDQESFYYFFERIGKRMTNKLNRAEKDKINNATNADQFDITIMYKYLRYCTDKLANGDDLWRPGHTNIESQITELKNLRNEVSHESNKYTEQEFHQKTEQLKLLLTNILHHVGRIYCVSVHQEVIEMTEELENYRDNPVEDEDLAKYAFEKKCDRVSTEGKDYIKKEIIRSKETDVRPVNHVIQMSVNVEDVFINMKMKTSEGVEEEVNYEDILKDIIGNSSDPIKTMVGVAGAGKSTVLQKMLSEYANGQFIMKGLDNYEIIIHHECRDTSTNSFNRLLEEKLPNIAKDFKDDELRKVVLHLKTMVLLDGLDELNPASIKLFDELLQLKKTRGITLIFTTRPEKLRYLNSRLQSHGLVKKEVTLQGIPENKRHTFVKQYHSKLAKKEQNKNVKPVEGLITYLERTKYQLGRLWALPYNLVLITILYIAEFLTHGNTVKHTTIDEITTEPELYKEIQMLCRTKLKERLKDNENTKAWDDSKTKWVIDMFLHALTKESLIGLMRDQINLPTEAYERLLRVCRDCKVPEEQMISAFLKPVPTKSSEIVYGFPHKGIQDYLAAQYVWMMLTGNYLSLEAYQLKAAVSSALSSCSAPVHTSHNIMKAVDSEIRKGNSEKVTDKPKIFDAEKTMADIESALVKNHAPQDLIQDILRLCNDKVKGAPTVSKSSPTTSQPPPTTSQPPPTTSQPPPTTSQPPPTTSQPTKKKLKFRLLKVFHRKQPKGHETATVVIPVLASSPTPAPIPAPTPAPTPAQPPAQECNAIRKFLEDIHNESSVPPQSQSASGSGSDLEIEKFQNMFKCLLGITHTEGTDIPNENKLEILQLLEETGVKDRDAWLNILSSVKCDEFVANYISKQQNLLKGKIKIDDSTLLPYTCLLKALKSPEAVKDAEVQLRFRGSFMSDGVLIQELERLGIQIQEVLITDLNLDEYLPLLKNLKKLLNMDHGITVDVEGNASQLIDMLREVNNLKLNVESMELHHYFRTCTRPDTKCQEEINHILKRCSVESYKGAYVEGMRLPSGDGWQAFSVATSADYRSLTEELRKNKGRLGGITLCVSSEIAASDLKEPIPVEGQIDLILPDASDIEETSKMAKALLPVTGQFEWLLFPRCGMKSSSGEMERLLQNLLHLKVKVYSAVVFPSPEKPGRGSAEEEKLENLARQLGAAGGILWGGFSTDIDEW